MKQYHLQDGETIRLKPPIGVSFPAGTPLFIARDQYGSYRIHEVDEVRQANARAVEDLSATFVDWNTRKREVRNACEKT